MTRRSILLPQALTTSTDASVSPGAGRYAALGPVVRILGLWRARLGDRSPRLLPICLALVALGLPGGARGEAPATLATPEPSPVAIHGGTPNETCAWPTAVAVLDNTSTCSGTLVHPRVVMYAAHCGADDKRIVFGENAGNPNKTVKPDLCLVNPDSAVPERDWAFCRLPQAITELPVTPVVFGCETEIVYVGQTAAITGFGVTEQGGSLGIKNWALTKIYNVASNTAKMGGNGVPTTCSGDSGGPSFARYPDGSWHTLGIASTQAGLCGAIVTHSLTWNAVPWVEQESGIDITPCHDVDGTWNPTYKCANFYAGEPGVGVGEWLQWCPGTPTSGSSSTCGAPFDAKPDNSPPTVAITTPMSADYPDQDSLTTPIEVSADDGDGWGVVAVSLKINGELQPLTDEEPPYAFANVKLPEGSFELIAVAEDAAGLIAESEPVTINIGAAPVDPTGGDIPTTADADTNADTGTNGDPNASDGDGDGCGCRGEARTPAGLALLLLLGLRRRRRGQTVGGVDKVGAAT